MARVLVTGGAGFLGSHLCDRLVSEGHEVHCLDDFSTGNRANIEHLVGRTRFRAIAADVVDRIDGDFDEIYHLACPASPLKYQRNPLRTAQICTEGALRVLEAARRTGARVLLASTSEVYGDPFEHPQNEDTPGSFDPSSPRACYEQGKRMAEVLFHDARRKFGARIKVLRIFNTYGPGMQPDDGRVIPRFVEQARLGKPLTVHGGGQQTRSFCYVDDMVGAFQALMSSPEGVTGPFNAGNPEEVKIIDLAHLVLRLTNSQSRIELVAAADGDPRRRCPDLTRMAAATGWQPSVPLSVGLKAVIGNDAEKHCPGSVR